MKLRLPAIFHALLHTLAGTLIALYGCLLFITTRRVFHTPKPTLNTPAIFAFWHGRVTLVMGIMPNNRQNHVLISGHKDGRMIAIAAMLLGKKVITGSNKKGAISATKKMILAAKTGSHLYITPDAPPKRAYEVSNGVVDIARLAGIPIIPVALSITRGKQLNNKDRFVIALPFSTIHVAYGAPIYCNHKATKPATIAAFTAAARTLTQQMDTAAGHPNWSQ